MRLAFLATTVALGIAFIGYGSGCHGVAVRSETPLPESARSMRGDPEELKALWTSILASARAGSAQAVSEELRAFALQPDDIRRLLREGLDPEIYMQFDISAVPMRWLPDGPASADRLRVLEGEVSVRPMQLEEIRYPRFQGMGSIADPVLLEAAFRRQTQFYAVDIRSVPSKPELHMEGFFWDGARWRILGYITAIPIEVAGARRVAENEIRSICDQVLLYREIRSGLPASFAELIQAKLVKNAEADGTILDPWRRPYEYSLDPAAKDGFVVLSRGSDTNDPEDDIRSDRLRQ